MDTIMIGMDIAKSVFHLHGVSPTCEVVIRRKLSRGKVLKYLGAQPRGVVAMEACGSAHYWAREIMRLGHEVRLIAPRYVKAYVKRGKNDAVDAEAICEAASRPSMRFVPVKSAASQAVLVQHRVREMLVRQRTAQINALRGLLSEFGLVAAKGVEGRAVLERLVVEADPRIPEPALEALRELVAAIRAGDARVRQLERTIAGAARSNEVARRLATIPGVGPILASAAAAMVADPAAFRNGRHFAAWTGLTPRQDSTGGVTRLRRISKMGDRYLRKLLVLGATSVLRIASRRRTPLERWADDLMRHTPSKRRATVAIANKLARILWAVMARQQPYQPALAAA